jgi:hypothetical protein
LCFNIKYPKCPKGGGRRVFSNEQLFSQNPQNLKKRRLLYMTLKRGLAFVTIIAIIGVAGCTTTAPSILSFMGLPATMNVGNTATLTATGNPGSTQGLWDWVFTVSPAGCGSVSPASFPPGTLTTVTTTFTALSAGTCTVTVTIKTAAGRSASASQTTTIGAPPPLLPACTQPELADPGVPSGGVDNHPIIGAAGDRAFAYVQVYGVNHDTILHLRIAPLAGPSNCPGGSLECDDDDGATYTSIGGTFIAHGFNSVIAGHPLATASDVVSVNGWFGAAVDPYRLYRHVVPAANLVTFSSDPGNTPATAFPVPTAPTPWMIGERIDPAGDADWYAFYANAGEAIFVALDMTPDSPSGSHDDLSAWDAVLELRSSTGALLIPSPPSPVPYVDGSAAFGSPAPPAEAFAIRINTSGTYFIAVRHFSAAGTGPGYHLTACRTPTVLPAGAEEPLGGKPFTPKYPDDK